MKTARHHIRLKVGLLFLTFAVSLSLAGSPDATAQDVDYSNEIHPVVFMPWADRKLAIRSPDGSWVGYSKGSVPLQINFDGNTFRAAMDPVTQEIDVPKLLSSLSPRRGSDGQLYFTMKVVEKIELADGRVVQASTDEAPSEVLLNVNDFYVTKSIQPFEASSQVPTPTAEAATQRFNHDLQENGVTAATRPTSPQTADDARDDEPLPNVKSSQDEDETELPALHFSSGSYGNPFPQKIFSSPVCSCLGGECGISSGFGFRAHRNRRGRYVTFRNRNGSSGSKFHKGIDIHTSARENGTPVVAAAWGCLPIPKGRKRGDRVTMREIYAGGYGYTIRMMHGNGFETQYSHLKSISKALKWGSCFDRGDRLGSMGDSGNATGPHLHFGVYKDGLAIDPKPHMLGASGAFYSPSCKDQPDYSELDKEMRTDLIEGRAHNRAAARSSSVR